MNKLLKGNVVLEQRPRSPYYFARMKVNGRWIVRTTKEKSIGEAIPKALKLYENEKDNPKHHKPRVNFDTYCLTYRQLLLSKLIQKPIYETYLRMLENHIRPYFKDHSSISQRDIASFYDWHAAKFPAIPAKSTINTLNVVMRGVCAIALEAGFLSAIPTFTVKDRGRDVEARDAFSIDEYRSLYKASRRWKSQETHRKISAYKRKILHELILFIANTGIRPGKETRAIEWKDITIEPDYIRVHVRHTKTRKSRIALGRKSLKRSLERLRELTGHHKLVFSMPDGSPFRWEAHMFTRLLNFAEMNPRLTLYGLRHFYATQRVLRRVPYPILAKQMGTSPRMLSEHYDKSVVEAFPEYFMQ